MVSLKNAEEVLPLKSIRESTKSVSAGVAGGLVVHVAPEISITPIALGYFGVVVTTLTAYTVLIHWIAENAFVPSKDEQPSDLPIFLR